jgi:hypothetical protein
MQRPGSFRRCILSEPDQRDDTSLFYGPSRGTDRAVEDTLQPSRFVTVTYDGE